MRKSLLLTWMVLCASSASAQAIGFRTQMSCAGDYYAYCSQHAPGSPGVRKCMRAAGPKLSKGCIDALIADGEVSRAEVEKHKAKLAGAKAKPKTAEPKKADVADAAKKAQPDTKKDAKKAEVAQKKVQPAETTNPAPKLAAAPQPAKPKSAARASVASLPAATEAAGVTQTPESQTVSLDQATFEALKNRGAAFVVGEDGGTGVAEQPQPVQAAPDAGVATTDAWVARTEPAPAASEETPDEASASAIETAGVGDSESDAARQTIEYPPGRMSLGRKLDSSNRDPEPSSSWWDQLVEAVTGE